MCKNAIVFSNKPKGIKLEAGVKYSMCACGRSEDGIFCDGSHLGTNCLPKEIVVEKTKPQNICLCKSSKNFPFCDGIHSYYIDEEIGKTIKY